MMKTHGPQRHVPRPSLRSLEVFAAAAECGNFTTAGDQLRITQSAVSRQISDLEGILGVTLFLRRGAHLTLTPTGARFAERLGLALRDMRLAVSEITNLDTVVTVSMLPSVAAKWLAPRLGAFVSSHPHIDLRVSASRHLVDFSAEGIDAAIRYGPPPTDSVDSTHLADETVTPVASPGYIQGAGLQSPGDLAHAALLHGDIVEDWDAWFNAAGVSTPPPEGPRLGDDTAILQAAIEGHGVALGRSRLVADDLDAGRLVAPFDVRLAASYDYWFVHPKHIQTNAALAAFKLWVSEAFRAD